jgi:hypothetical protein
VGEAMAPLKTKVGGDDSCNARIKAWPIRPVIPKTAMGFIPNP